jgi:hypothetical protein
VRLNKEGSGSKSSETNPNESTTKADGGKKITSAKENQRVEESATESPDHNRLRSRQDHETFSSGVQRENLPIQASRREPDSPASTETVSEHKRGKIQLAAVVAPGFPRIPVQLRNTSTAQSGLLH